MKGFNSSSSLRALGFAPVWFLAAMASPQTARLALPLLAVVAVWSAWRGKLDLAGRLDAIEWGLIVFAIAWIACALTALDPGRSLRLSIPMLAAVVALFVLRREREAEPALVSFDAALFLLGFVQCLQLLPPLLAGLGGEAAVQQSDALWLVEPNDIAWIAATWPPLLALPWTGTRRALIALPIVLGLMLMIVLGSRLALIASVLALVPTLARSPRRMLTLAFALAGGLSLAAWWIDPSIFAKGSASMASRLQLWHAAGQIFYDWPWMGTGPHGFALAYERYLPAALALDPRETPWPHSLPLEIAAVTGLTGILATGLLICCVFLHSRGGALAAGDRRVVAVQCLVFAVLALFEASFLRLWVWMLAASILCRLPRRPEPAIADFSLTNGECR
jgi:O-antigen ligase